MRLLGLDPGFASVGYALVDWDGRVLKLDKVGCFRTEKAKPPKVARGKNGQPKRAVERWIKPSVSEDNFRRTAELAKFFLSLVESNVEAICVESMSYPRNASSAAKMSLCWGALAAVTVTARVPIEILQVTPKQIKKSLGCKSNDKAEVIAGLNALYGEETILKAGVGNEIKSVWEHPYDALGAIHTCLKDPSIVRSTDIERIMAGVSETIRRHYPSGFRPSGGTVYR